MTVSRPSQANGGDTVNCPTCGCEVRVVGDTTKHHEPVRAAMNEDEEAYERQREYADECYRKMLAAEAEVASLRRERDEAIERADGMARAPYGEFQKAVDEVATLRRERDELRAALREIKKFIAGRHKEGDTEYQVVILARAALAAATNREDGTDGS